MLDDPFPSVDTPKSFHDLIVASRFPFDFFSVASFQMIVASHSSVASSVVASRDYLDTSGVASIQLIVVSHSVEKVSYSHFRYCTALCKGDSMSQLIVELDALHQKFKLLDGPFPSLSLIVASLLDLG